MRNRLIAARKKAKLTQLQLAQKVGLCRASICHMERGRIEGPTKTWKAIAKVLGVKNWSRLQQMEPSE